MSEIRRSSRCLPCSPVKVAVVGVAALLIVAGASYAQERGFYAGYTASAEQFDATFSKSVDNTEPDTLAPEPRRGMVFHDTSSADTVDLGLLATTWGIGVEKRIGSGEYMDRIVLRFEARYSDYGDESWVADFPDVRVTVPSTLEADGVGVTVSMVRLFGRGE